MRTVLRQAFVLASLWALSVLVSAQVPAPPLPTGQAATASSAPDPNTAFVLGRVVDGGTNKPLSAVTVMLMSGTPPAVQDPGAPPATLSRLPLRVVTDGAGQFVFRGLPAGSYVLGTEKAGYGRGSLGRRSAQESSNQTLALGVGERKGGVVLRVWRMASIVGTIVDETGEPVVGLQVRAFVRATQAGRLTYGGLTSATTDDRGIYRLSSLSPGDYVVAITSTQATVPSAMLDATRGANYSDPIMRELERSGASVEMALATGGQRVGNWVLAIASSGQFAPSVRGDRVFIYPTTFHPSATLLSQATVIPLASGEERTGVDFQVRAVPTYRVSGQLAGPDGPEVFTTLELVPPGAEDLSRDSDLVTAVTMSDRGGAFTFMGVPPGSYTIRTLKIPARTLPDSSATTVIQTGTTTIMSSSGLSIPPPIPDTPTYSASAPVSVSTADVSGVQLRLQPGARFSGRFEFDGTAAKPPVAQLRTAYITVDRADGRTSSQFTLARAVVDQDGQFKTYQLPPARYTLRVPNIGTWNLKSAMWKDRDLADSPIDLGAEDIGDVVITMTDRPASLSGTVRNSRNVDATATVFVFPVSPAAWSDHGATPRRFRSARAGTDGSYRLTPMPAGDYLVTAITSVAPTDWMDPSYLRKLAAQATRVTIADGEAKVQGLESKEVR